MSTTSFESFAEYYDEVMGDTGDYTHQQTIDPALLKAAGNVKGKIVYDIGCGNGYMARKLYKMGARELWASDISPVFIRLAKNKYPTYGINYFICDGADFSDLPEDYFDLVTLNMSIHYIKNLNKLFEGISNVLKVGGKVAFTIDHPLKPLSHFDSKRIDSFREVVNKARIYTKSVRDVVFNHWTGKRDLVIYKRPLGKYIKIMSNNGLYVTSFIEPKTKAIKSYKTMEKISSDIPTVVAICAIKSV